MDKKAKWVRPVLITLSRFRTDEHVLAACKHQNNHPGGYPESANQMYCRVDQCVDCETYALS